MKLFDEFKKRKLLTHICIVLIISAVLCIAQKVSIKTVPFYVINITFLYCMFLIIKYFVKDLIKGYKTYEPSPTSDSKEKKYSFRYKSEWVWEDAAMEYLKLKNKENISELTQEEKETIYKYASMPIAYFAMWLIDNNFLDNDTYDTSNQLIIDIKNRKKTPVELISNMDYYFSGQDITAKIIPFVEMYYNDLYDRGCMHKEESDYYQCIKNNSGFYYCVDFSWENYDKIAQKINDAYKKNGGIVEPVIDEKTRQEEIVMINEISEELKRQTIIDNYKIGFTNEKCDFFDSKIGGMPYWNTNLEYPRTSDGENLVLLAQINFEREQFNDDRLPKKGILQFFVKNNWLWMENEEYKVVYHENIDDNFNLETFNKLNVKTTLNSEINIDVKGEHKIVFKKNQEAISVDDYHFDTCVWNICSKKYGFDELEFDEKYYDGFRNDLRDKFELGNGSKLLGYPGFCQFDPREDIPNGKDLFLLFQLDGYNNITPYDRNIRLKDGILNFFITAKDLENKNFDNVIMHGDFH